MRRGRLRCPIWSFNTTAIRRRCARSLSSQAPLHLRRVQDSRPGRPRTGRSSETVTIAITVILLGALVWLLFYMLAQKPFTSVQQLIQRGRYADAVAAAGEDWIHRAEALKLLGRFEEAIESYRK